MQEGVSNYFEKYSHEPIPELSADEREVSDRVRTEFFEAVDRTLIRQLDEDAPRIPESERALRDLVGEDGRVIAQIDQIRTEQNDTRWGKAETPHDEFWFVFDFDDVLNKTTEFYQRLSEHLSATCGVSVEEFKAQYDQAKIPNEQGKKVLQIEKLAEGLESVRAGSTEAIERFFRETDFSSYINQSCKRAVLSLESLHQPRTEFKYIILTYGDLAHQREKVTRSGVEDAFHEVIYTEGSKRQVLEALVRQHGGQKDKHPFIITFDDSPEHVEDYENLPFRDHVANVRFRHPQAKRYKKIDHAQTAIRLDERSKNQAAVDVYRLASILMSSQNIRSTSGEAYSREKIFRDLQDPERYEELLRKKYAYVESDTRYSKEGDTFIREANAFPMKAIKEEGHAVPQYDVDQYTIQTDGTVARESPLPGRPFTPKFDFEEYIRS